MGHSVRRLAVEEDPPLVPVCIGRVIWFVSPNSPAIGRIDEEAAPLDDCPMRGWGGTTRLAAAFMADTICDGTERGSEVVLESPPHDEVDESVSIEATKNWSEGVREER